MSQLLFRTISAKGTCLVRRTQNACYKQGEDKARIQRAPLFLRNGAAYV